MPVDNLTEDPFDISCTEKDSPYYNMDYNKLWDFQKRIHDLYVQGKVFHMNPRKTYEIQEKTRNRMENWKREDIKKQHQSYIDAKKVILNA